MLSGYHLSLPELPAVPTAPLTPAARRDLVLALQSCKGWMAHQAFQKWTRKAYARLWIHLALERGLDPRKVSTPGTKGHQVVVAAFLAAGKAIGLHDRVALVELSQELANAACRLWMEAKQAQGSAPAQLLGLDLPAASPKEKS